MYFFSPHLWFIRGPNAISTPITYLLLIAAFVTSFLPPKFYGLDVFSIGYCTTFGTMNYKGTDF